MAMCLAWGSIRESQAGLDASDDSRERARDSYAFFNFRYVCFPALIVSESTDLRIFQWGIGLVEWGLAVIEMVIFVISRLRMACIFRWKQYCLRKRELVRFQWLCGLQSMLPFLLCFFSVWVFWQCGDLAFDNSFTVLVVNLPRILLSIIYKWRLWDFMRSLR